ncbi:MAG TPA: hypothetical protein VLX92_19015 [Kofleriaceae bacterium]|nr:hypothetical protein [Kofleriaceae bacterium]
MKPAPCDFSGSYRIRFASNGSDGWWLRWKIAGGKAEVTAKDVMDVFPQGPVAFAADGCTGTISAHTDHSGDTRLVFTLDPASNAIAGKLSRTLGGGSGADNGPETVPVAGRRDVGPLGPACVKPGVYQLGFAKAKWKLEEGHPRALSCKDMNEVAATRVRIEPLGDQLFVDEVSGDANEQGFGRGKATRTGDCAYDVVYEIETFKLDGSLVFAGDAVTGRAKQMHYTFIEDGTAGENEWTCATRDAELAIKRIAE